MLELPPPLPPGPELFVCLSVCRTPEDSVFVTVGLAGGLGWACEATCGLGWLEIESIRDLVSCPAASPLVPFPCLLLLTLF